MSELYSDATTKRLTDLSQEDYDTLRRCVLELLIRFPDKTRHELTLDIYIADLPTPLKNVLLSKGICSCSPNFLSTEGSAQAYFG